MFHQCSINLNFFIPIFAPLILNGKIMAKKFILATKRNERYGEPIYRGTRNVLLIYVR